MLKRERVIGSAQGPVIRLADGQEMINLWQALNRQLLAAAEAVPESAWSRTCTIADSSPLSLKFVFEDYIDHMVHHLKHIGVEVNDRKPEA